MTQTTVIGRPIEELDTPALLLDLPLCRQNLTLMANFFADKPAQLRPHFKNHKCTRLAKLQRDHGSFVGMTCANLEEAEALVAAGFDDVLIANQVIGEGKLRRLAKIAGKTRLTVAVDDLEQTRSLSAVAEATEVTIGLLLEIDNGMHRCGVTPGPASLELAKQIVGLSGIRFHGLQSFEGHVIYIDDLVERSQKTTAAMQRAQQTKQLLEDNGIPTPTISGGSSSTYTIAGTMDGITEIQAGTYATMDCRYQRMVPEFKIAMSILATVISCNSGRAVLNTGVKHIGAEFGLPEIKGLPDVEIPFFGSEEHCTVQNIPQHWKVGQTVEVYPTHACTTCNLYRQMFVHENGFVVDVWPIDGRS
jgi:D-serine deaminase-like pyridoxal phosphate-dependent protein